MQIKPITPSDLDSYVANSRPEANFLQSSSWGKVYELTGSKVQYLGLFDKNTIVGSCVTIIKSARRGRYLEIPGGPLIDWHSTKQVTAMLATLKDLATTEHCIFVRMRPNIADTSKNRQIFNHHHLRISPMHLHAEHTIMLDLTKTETELLADMRRQTRYEVRRADKLAIRVTSSSTKSAFREFYQTQLATAKRQSFIPSSEDFILAQHTAFGDTAKIYRAELGNKLLATSLIILQSPEAIYHEAASTPAGRSLPGAYALQWQVIRDAKAAGLKRYNLFGIAPHGATHHRYAGVTTFKKGFGGEEVNYIPAHDLVVNPIRYQLTKSFELIRKKKRNL